MAILVPPPGGVRTYATSFTVVYGGSPHSGSFTVVSGRSSSEEESSRQYQGIVKTPGICGGDARVENTRIPVWGLVRSRELVGDDRKLLEVYPHVTREDLENAWTYYRENPKEIDDSIYENERG